MTKKIRILLIGLGSFLAAVTIAISFFVVQFLNSGVSSDTSEVLFDVPPGKNMTQIASDLQQMGLVRNGSLFLLYSRFKRMNSRLKVGEYSLSKNLTPDQILAALISGKSVTRNLTIAEGLSVFDIAGIFEQSGLGTRKDFLELVHNKEFIKSLLNEDLESLEGYLFPETYKITKFETMKNIVAQMVRQFQIVWARYEILAQQKKWTRNHLVTFASIIEKETGAGFERPLVSSVFHNRLAKKMKLQTDPTVLYGLAVKKGEMPNNISKIDLLTPNRYNSYTNYGLPPTPICNPGEEAIKAAFQPATTNYLFFVSKNDGTHVFSETYANHNAAVKNFQVNPKAREGKSWRDLKKNQAAQKKSSP